MKLYTVHGHLLHLTTEDLVEYVGYCVGKTPELAYSNFGKGNTWALMPNDIRVNYDSYRMITHTPKNDQVIYIRLASEINLTVGGVVDNNNVYAIKGKYKVQVFDRTKTNYYNSKIMHDFSGGNNILPGSFPNGHKTVGSEGDYLYKYGPAGRTLIAQRLR